MAGKYSAFSYKQGNSFFHRIPAWIKIIFIPFLNIIVFNLPWYFSAGFVVLQFIFACCLKFSFREQAADLKPVIWYGIILYGLSFLGHFASGLNSISQEGEAGSQVLSVLEISASTVFLNWSTALLLLKLFAVMQSASIFFKTSTSLEIREGVGLIESRIRKFFHLKSKNTVTNTISLFVCFIPMIYRIWSQSKKAWIARSGKKGIKMYATLLPVLFSVGMKQAFNSAKAVAVRDL